jgi:hypothetical protein
LNAEPLRARERESNSFNHFSDGDFDADDGFRRFDEIIIVDNFAFPFFPFFDFPFFAPPFFLRLFCSKYLAP